MLDLARIFLRLGATAFGGPLAHISIMEREFVRKRQWLSHGDFLDLISAANLIPGPNSTEVALHIGFRRAGYRGLLVAGTAFIFPAFVLVTILAAIYARYQALPQVNGVLEGIRPIVVVIILKTLTSLFKPTFKIAFHWVLLTILVVLRLCGFEEVALVFLAAALGLAYYYIRINRKNGLGLNAFGASVLPEWFGGWFKPTVAQTTEVLQLAPAPSLSELFTYFVKIGAVMYGSGYVLVAYLNRGLVHSYHWLSPQQLLDAVSIGQVTPGPLFTTASFAGFLLGGWLGSVVATIGIFLPAFVFVALTAPFMAKLSRWGALRASLDAVNVASFVLIAFVLVELLNSTITDAFSFTIGIAALITYSRIPSTVLIGLGAAFGWLFH